MRERILKILEDKEITQTEFATIIGVNPSSITHLIRGRDKFSQTVASRTLLAYPEINFLWMLKGEGEMYVDTIEKQNKNSQGIEQINKAIEEELANVQKNELTDNQQEIKQDNVPQKINIRNTLPTEDAIRPFEELVDAVSHATHQGKMQLTQPQKRKKIEKIVFFYSDQSFEEYYPTS